MGKSPTQRTLELLREEGKPCWVVERWITGAKKRVDLFNIIDVLALDFKRGVIGIQCCAGSGYTSHFQKLTADHKQESQLWLRTPGTALYLYAWRKLKVKRGGKAIRWMPRVVEITKEDLQ